LAEASGPVVAVSTMSGLCAIMSSTSSLRHRRAAASMSGRASSGSVITRRCRNVGLDALLQMHNDVGVCGDVVYPVPCAVSTRHPGDEQHAILIVQVDLDAARESAPATGGRQVDELTSVQGLADVIVHTC
jgi:hypothetical protein